MTHNVEKAPRLLRTECSINVFTLLSRLKQVKKLTSRGKRGINKERGVLRNAVRNIFILAQ